MDFTVDCEHIFFDRFNLSDCEKFKEAKMVICKALDEIGCDFTFSDNSLFIAPCNFETQNDLRKTFDLLKREFFIVINGKAIKKEVVSRDIVTDATKYIKRHFLNESLSVEAVCDALNIKRGVLDNLFKRKFEKTVKEYILNLRVDAAKELLKDGESIEKCADLCGFGSSKTLTRAFKAVCGVTPGLWRSRELDSNGAK